MVIEARGGEKLGLAVIDDIGHKHNIQRGAVIPILHEIQETFGYIPPVAIERVAENLAIPASEIYGVATFYALFRLQPLGKNHIKVCHGTACHLAGAERISQALTAVVGGKEGETSQDGKFTVERVACFGCCSMAPCIMVNGEIHGRLTPGSVHKVVDVQETERLTSGR